MITEAQIKVVLKAISLVIPLYSWIYKKIDQWMTSQPEKFKKRLTISVEVFFIIILFLIGIWIFFDLELNQNYLKVRESYFNVVEDRYPYELNNTYHFYWAIKSKTNLDDLSATPFVIPLSVDYKDLPLIHFNDTNNLDLKKGELEEIQGIILTQQNTQGRYLICGRIEDNSKKNRFTKPKEQFIDCSKTIFPIGTS